MWHWLAFAAALGDGDAVIIDPLPPVAVPVAQAEAAPAHPPVCAECGRQVLPHPPNVPAESIYRRRPSATALPAFALPAGTRPLMLAQQEGAGVAAAPPSDALAAWLARRQSLPPTSPAAPQAEARFAEQLRARAGGNATRQFAAPPSMAAVPANRVVWPPAVSAPANGAVAVGIPAPAEAPAFHPQRPFAASTAMAGPLFRIHAPAAPTAESAVARESLAPLRVVPSASTIAMMPPHDANVALALEPAVAHEALAILPVLLPPPAAASAPAISLMLPADAWTASAPAATASAPAALSRGAVHAVPPLEVVPPLPLPEDLPRALRHGGNADPAPPKPAALAAAAWAKRREVDALPTLTGTVHRADNASGLWLLRTPEGATYRLKADPQTMPLADRSLVEVSGTVEPAGARETWPTLVARRVSVYVR